jgi:hypothetical protein
VAPGATDRVAGAMAVHRSRSVGNDRAEIGTSAICATRTANAVPVVPQAPVRRVIDHMMRCVVHQPRSTPTRRVDAETVQQPQPSLP